MAPARLPVSASAGVSGSTACRQDGACDAERPCTNIAKFSTMEILARRVATVDDWKVGPWQGAGCDHRPAGRLRCGANGVTGIRSIACHTTLQIAGVHGE